MSTGTSTNTDPNTDPNTGPNTGPKGTPTYKVPYEVKRGGDSKIIRFLDRFLDDLNGDTSRNSADGEVPYALQMTWKRMAKGVTRVFPIDLEGPTDADTDANTDTSNKADLLKASWDRHLLDTGTDYSMSGESTYLSDRAFEALTDSTRIRNRLIAVYTEFKFGSDFYSDEREWSRQLILVLRESPANSQSNPKQMSYRIVYLDILFYLDIYDEGGKWYASAVQTTDCYLNGDGELTPDLKGVSNTGHMKAGDGGHISLDEVLDAMDYFWREQIQYAEK